MRALEHVAPPEQYDHEEDYDYRRHLTRCAVENATLFRVAGLHCHDSLLGPHQHRRGRTVLPNG